MRIRRITSQEPVEAARILNAGAGRGATLNLEHLSRFNQGSTRFRLEPKYVDPVPEKALKLAETAEQQGVPATWQESTIQDALHQSNGHDAVIVNVDTPTAAAQTLEQAQPVIALAYMIILLPRGMAGVRLVLQPVEDQTRKDAAAFFYALATFTARSGSEYILGEKGKPANRLAEPAYRRWFGDHTKKNLSKALGGLTPEANPFEVTLNGRTSTPAVVKHSPDGWRSPADLAEESVENPPLPLVRGEDFMVVELGPDGVRFYQVRLRKLDGQPAVRAAALLDPVSVELALKRAERETVTKTRPAFTTD